MAKIDVRQPPGYAADGSALVPKSLYDANTILAADSDNTPAALTMAASTILARLAAGNIKAATPAEIKTLLAIASGDVSGLGGAAVLNVGTTTGTVAAGDDARIIGGFETLVPVSGRLLLPSQIGATTQGAGSGTVNMGVPFKVSASCSISAIGLDITALDTTAIVRTAVYTLTNAGALPLLYDATADGSTNIDASAGTGATGYKEQTFAHNQTLSPGTVYVLAAQATGGNPTLRVCRARAFGNKTAAPADLSDPYLTTGYRRTGVAGAFTDPFVANAFGIPGMFTAKVV